MIKPRPWQEIAGDFTDTLLIGNGASISLGKEFGYNSILDYARSRNLVTSDVDLVFTYANTSDFELVMRMLWHALNVNKALGITEKRTDEAYHSLRGALIRSVREIHVSYDSVSARLEAIQGFAGRFKTVLSLNYDLTLYWAMLVGNTLRDTIWFKDCWIYGFFADQWEQYRKPYRVGGDATLVFYPHGNLVLATDPRYGEVKLASGAAGNTLLSRVISAWEDDNCLPMFVSEGESKQKEAAITRHSYLNTVYNDVMRESRDSIVCYGWSMAENDEHILRRLCHSGPQRMAVSVYRGARSDQEVDLECRRVRDKIERFSFGLPIEFFDSESAGCWANP